QPPQLARASIQSNAPQLSSGVAAILVLPFTVAGEANERSVALADRISDDLTNTLSRVGGFRIISRQTALTLRGARVEPTAIGEQLGVRYLLQGSVEAQEAIGQQRLFATLELIETKGSRHVWSARFDRTGRDLPALADEIVKSVGRELQVEITQVEA